MVRISKHLYQEAYEYIKEDSSKGNCIVFVSADVDSLCAASILQSLLKTDMITYKLVPISGYKDLERAKERLVATDDELVSIIMINCGGLIDAREFFEIDEYTKIYILDSHRPLHLSNLDPKNMHVCVLDEDEHSDRFDLVMDAYDAVTYTYDGDSANEDSDESEEERMDPVSKRRRLNREGDTHKTSRHRKMEQRRLLAGYYTVGSYHASSSSAIVYEIASQLSKANNDLLWLAITGVTAQYLYERIDTKKYIESIKIFRDDTARFNIRDEGSTQDDAGGEIEIGDEYRFMLLRHWSLYDSMYYSSYVASTLSLWNDTENNKLHSFFALMGFRLEQCRQIYAHMDIDLKSRLQTKIEEISPHLGLTELSYPSFTRTYDNTCTLSASDMVYALSAILETSPTTAVRLGLGTHTKNKDWHYVVEADTADEVYSESHRWWLRNFFQAHDAINRNTPDVVLYGIRLSMETQKAISSHVSAAISKREFRMYPSFRYLLINGGPDLAMLQHPLALQRLALFSSDMYRVSVFFLFLF
ncbi:CDC45 family [Sporodiniella umbellata]|nr:CDC45 family [Sporodiniella umbellata]